MLLFSIGFIAFLVVINSIILRISRGDRWKRILSGAVLLVVAPLSFILSITLLPSTGAFSESGSAEIATLITTTTLVVNGMIHIVKGILTNE